MRDRDMGRFRPIHGPSWRRHGISQSATLSLPSGVMNLRRLISDIAFEERSADQYEDSGEMRSFVMLITDERSADALLDSSDDQVR